MAIRKITRKVITPRDDLKIEKKQVKEEVKVEESAATSQTGEKTKKECTFCKLKTTPSYTDMGVLRRFQTDRAKIVNKERSGVCSKHQRGVSKNIKYARHLALLPFIPKV